MMVCSSRCSHGKKFASLFTIAYYITVYNMAVLISLARIKAFCLTKLIWPQSLKDTVCLLL